MTPEMIEACAKLCRWKEIDGLLYTAENKPACNPFTVMLPKAGLLAVEDALLKKGWHPLPYTKHFGYSWVCTRKEIPHVRHPDRATAAAMAAMEQVR